MAFRFPFFKSKDAPPADEAPIPAIPPPVPAPVPAAQPPSIPPAPETAAVPPRQSSLASALKAATSHTTGGGEIQSSLFRPKVNVNLKSSAVGGATPSPEPAAPSPAPATEVPSSVELAVADILPLLPHNLLKESAPQEGMPSVISISTADILPQLATGKVQVPLDVLISTFPQAMVDASVAGSDDIKIKIPLHLIIPKLSASAIALPDTQLRQEVGASIGTPFSERKVGPRLSAAPTNGTSTGATMIAPSSPLTTPKVAIPPVVKAPSLPPPLPRPSVPAPKIPPPAAKMVPSSPAFPIKLPPLVPVTSLPRSVAPIPAPATPPSVPPPSRMSFVPPIKLPPPTLPPAMVPGATIPATGPVPVRTSTLPILRTSTFIPAKPSNVLIPPPATNDENTPTVLVSPSRPSEAPSVAAAASIPPAPQPAAAEAMPPAAAPRLKQTASLREMLGIAEETPLRLQDLSNEILRKLAILGVLIVAEDGQLLAGSLSPKLDSQGWSRLAPQLFRKFTGEDKDLGRPRRCFLEVGGHGFSLWNERGIHLVLCHRPEEIGSKFEEHGDHLAREVALFCQRRGAAV